MTKVPKGKVPKDAKCSNCGCDLHKILCYDEFGDIVCYVCFQRHGLIGWTIEWHSTPSTIHEGKEKDIVIR